MAKANSESKSYGVGDVFEIRKGDKLNIGVPEYVVVKNSTSPAYVNANNIIMIGSILKPEKRYTDDDLFVALTEAVHKVSGIAPSKVNNLSSCIEKLIVDIGKIERKLAKVFDTSVFIGEWRIDSIEPCRENGVHAVVKMTKFNIDGSIMNNFIRVYGNERIKFKY